MTRNLSKNQKRRLKKKLQKQLTKLEDGVESTQEEGTRPSPTEKADEQPLDVEYTVETTELEVMPKDDLFAQFEDVFDRFLKEGEEEEEEGGEEEEEDSEDEEGDEENGHGQGQKGAQRVGKDGLSKKQRRKLNRLTVAQLKQLVERPDVVEAHDVTAQDPRLLVDLKARRNTVPVPGHWSEKREYLQGKRSGDRQIFQLPEFISETGISRVRAALVEVEAAKNARAMAKERVAPKMGQMDIDYQVLHDAFFRFQTKPPLTLLGDTYYEGKEFELKFPHKKPGRLSGELRKALGMTDELTPPPWLFNMQRFGPPPSYPSLKMPGLNAPLPDGCAYGYHAGGWGRPPVDEFNRPLYGDVFGVDRGASREREEKLREEIWCGDVDTAFRWGAMLAIEEEEEEDYSESEEEGEVDYSIEDVEEDEEDEVEKVSKQKRRREEMEEDDGLMTPLSMADGITSVSSVATGLDTPSDGLMNLRKSSSSQQGEQQQQGDDEDHRGKSLFKVLESRESDVERSEVFGSSQTYDLGDGNTTAGGTVSTGGMTSTNSMASSVVVDEEERMKRKEKRRRLEKEAEALEKRNAKAFKF